MWVCQSWPSLWPFGDQGQMKGSTVLWSGWLQDVRVSSTRLVYVHNQMTSLTRCGLASDNIVVTWQVLVNIGAGNGLLPDGTKPLPEPMLTILNGTNFSEIWMRMIQLSCKKKIINKKNKYLQHLLIYLTLPGNDYQLIEKYDVIQYLWFLMRQYQ